LSILGAFRLRGLRGAVDFGDLCADKLPRYDAIPVGVRAGFDNLGQCRGVRKRWPWLKHLFADGAYDRSQLMDKAAFRDFTIEVVKRSDAAVGFEVIPRPWVVERTPSLG
jgi:hypothetical protein